MNAYVMPKDIISIVRIIIEYGQVTILIIVKTGLRTGRLPNFFTVPYNNIIDHPQVTH